MHSDLKPANFILVRGRLKLIDFGIADAITGDTTNVMRELPVGTLNFIAPEALKPRDGDVSCKIGRPADVWSLGCILYRMLFNEHVYPNLNNIQKIYAISGRSSFRLFARGFLQFLLHRGQGD